VKKKLAALAGLLIGLGILLPPTAQADVPGCTSQFWMYNLRAATRIICDGPIEADGSWQRGRAFVAPSFIRTFCYGYYSTICDTRLIPELDVRDFYRVTPGTIPAGEPGWIA
jgi:hypothetical protein